MNLTPLYETSPPWILSHVPTTEDERWLPQYLFTLPGRSPVIRVLRGQKMRTRQSLMDEFGAALQFLEPFGENWYALKDCLSSLNEWLPGDAYILVIDMPEEVLIDESPDELHWLVVTIEEVAEWWSHPITDNGPFNRDAIPFHVVLRCEGIHLPEVRRRFGGLPLI